MSVRGLRLKYLLIFNDCGRNTVKSFKGFNESKPKCDSELL